MTPEIQAKFEAMERRIAELESGQLTVTDVQYIYKDLRVTGELYAKKVYTKRSGAYVELTT